MITLLKLVVQFLIPGFLEQLIAQSINCGNMGIYGVLLDYYNKRNLLYFSLFILFLCYLENLMLYGWIFLLITFLIYLYTCIKWMRIFINMEPNI